MRIIWLNLFRDIKFANLLLDRHDIVFLLNDFFLVRDLSSENLIRSGETICALRYMASN
ncbi:hypothetical protein MIDIC_390003 [Alphaproteobacteria bacterium]